MASAEMEALFAAAVDMARASFDKQGKLLPVFIADIPLRGLAIFCTPWRSNAEKVAIFNSMRALFRATGTRRYALAVEVWVAAVTADEFAAEEAGRYGGPPPSERADRREVVFLTGEEVGYADTLVGEWSIRRIGGRARLGEFTRLNTELKGRMANLLGPRLLDS